MMPLDRMPSVSVGILVPVGAAYDSHHHWRDGGGGLHASVRFDAGGYSGAHIQGEPAALRELAAALVLAADQAEGADPADASHPTTDATRSAPEAVVGS
jgi:hypothetical protein